LTVLEELLLPFDAIHNQNRDMLEQRKCVKNVFHYCLRDFPALAKERVFVMDRYQAGFKNDPFDTEADMRRLVEIQATFHPFTIRFQSADLLRSNGVWMLASFQGSAGEIFKGTFIASHEPRDSVDVNLVEQERLSELRQRFAC
jgi:hypothetical protein